MANTRGHAGSDVRLLILFGIRLLLFPVCPGLEENRDERMVYPEKDVRRVLYNAALNAGSF
ncbi:MAG: hypothetical protein DRH32_02290 [Deltaproteobacteria bacterium]|nr:MAG: hypothetical protein DRH32_02290 [Deltaproteobacteria bacterium]